MQMAELMELMGGKGVTIEGKAALCKERQDNHTVIDSCGMCFFLCDQEGVWPDDVLRFMETATGAGYTFDSAMLAGERIWNVERLFNLGAGITAEDDTLPKRFLEKPVLKGPFEGQTNRLGEMLPEYYQLRGWDENGVPTPEKLKELGLK
jgi:aldehyde:ferredoxin oxidoreductase